MPGFDRTGPRGFGPMTGRGMGPCGRGYGLGRGMGYGRGFNSGYGLQDFYPAYPYRSITKKEELEVLEDDSEALQEELKGIKERISELKTQK